MDFWTRKELSLNKILGFDLKDIKLPGFRSYGGWEFSPWYKQFTKQPKTEGPIYIPRLAARSDDGGDDFPPDDKPPRDKPPRVKPKFTTGWERFYNDPENKKQPFYIRLSDELPQDVKKYLRKKIRADIERIEPPELTPSVENYFKSHGARIENYIESRIDIPPEYKSKQKPKRRRPPVTTPIKPILPIITEISSPLRSSTMPPLPSIPITTIPIDRPQFNFSMGYDPVTFLPLDTDVPLQPVPTTTSSPNIPTFIPPAPPPPQLQIRRQPKPKALKRSQSLTIIDVAPIKRFSPVELKAARRRLKITRQQKQQQPKEFQRKGVGAAVTPPELLPAPKTKLIGRASYPRASISPIEPEVVITSILKKRSKQPKIVLPSTPPAPIPSADLVPGLVAPSTSSLSTSTHSIRFPQVPPTPIPTNLPPQTTRSIRFPQYPPTSLPTTNPFTTSPPDVMELIQEKATPFIFKGPTSQISLSRRTKSFKPPKQTPQIPLITFEQGQYALKKLKLQRQKRLEEEESTPRIAQYRKGSITIPSPQSSEPLVSPKPPPKRKHKKQEYSKYPPIPKPPPLPPPPRAPQPLKLPYKKQPRYAKKPSRPTGRKLPAIYRKKKAQAYALRLQRVEGKIDEMTGKIKAEEGLDRLANIENIRFKRKQEQLKQDIETHKKRLRQIHEQLPLPEIIPKSTEPLPIKKGTKRRTTELPAEETAYFRRTQKYWTRPISKKTRRRSTGEIKSRKKRR